MFKSSATAALLVFAAAAVTAQPQPSPQCSTGPVQCCQSTSSTVTSAINETLALLNINIQDVAVPIGLTCSPIDILGIGSGKCTAQTVCCQNNTFSGIIALGCNAISL